MADIRKLNNEEEYNEFIGNSGTLNILKGFATWCFPCKALNGTILALGNDEVEGVLMAEADVDDEWFEDYVEDLNIRGIPVLIAFRDGEEVDRVSGNISKDDLLAFIGRNR